MPIPKRAAPTDRPVLVWFRDDLRLADHRALVAAAATGQRMIAASFLIKHLLIDWRQGEAWFWDTLVGADPANNPASWQWVAGSGADAAPCFRIFNPVLQGAKFDPEGTYVRRWVPELAKLPAKHIRQPWDAPPAVLDTASIKLGRDYPYPIIALDKGRARALAAFDKIKR